MDCKVEVDAFNAGGSEDENFSEGICKHVEIKQENFDGWDAAT